MWETMKHIDIDIFIAGEEKEKGTGKILKKL